MKFEGKNRCILCVCLGFFFVSFSIVYLFDVVFLMKLGKISQYDNIRVHPYSYISSTLLAPYSTYTKTHFRLRLPTHSLLSIYKSICKHLPVMEKSSVITYHRNKCTIIYSLPNIFHAKLLFTCNTIICRAYRICIVSAFHVSAQFCANSIMRADRSLTLMARIIGKSNEGQSSRMLFSLSSYEIEKLHLQHVCIIL